VELTCKDKGPLGLPLVEECLEVTFYFKLATTLSESGVYVNLTVTACSKSCFWLLVESRVYDIEGSLMP
jgi:hypothetical protein